MNAYQCDRCFSYYSKNEAVTIPGGASDRIVTGLMLRDTRTDAKGSAMIRKSYDLCDKCAGELLDWLLFKGNR